MTFRNYIKKIKKYICDGIDITVLDIHSGEIGRRSSDTWLDDTPILKCKVLQSTQIFIKDGYAEVTIQLGTCFEKYNPDFNCEKVGIHLMDEFWGKDQEIIKY